MTQLFKLRALWQTRLVLVAAWAVAGCSSHDGPVYAGPGAGSLDAPCYTSYDCATGFCCTSPPCRGGMCTYPCRSDPDCPYGMRCDGGACFFACLYDSDCAWGQTCKKGHTICQY